MLRGLQDPLVAQTALLPYPPQKISTSLICLSVLKLSGSFDTVTLAANLIPYASSQCPPAMSVQSSPPSPGLSVLRSQDAHNSHGPQVPSQGFMPPNLTASVKSPISLMSPPDMMCRPQSWTLTWVYVPQHTPCPKFSILEPQPRHEGPDFPAFTQLASPATIKALVGHTGDKLLAQLLHGHPAQDNRQVYYRAPRP